MAAVGILGGAALTGVGMMRDHKTGSVLAGTFKDSSSTISTSASAATETPEVKVSPTTPTGPSSAEVAAQDRATRVKELDAALKKYAKTSPEFSVAVLDKKTGKRYAFRGTETYETASVVKVQVLACLLLTAQTKGRALTSNEKSLATRMIHASDNNATTALFNELGKAPAIGKCNKRLGLTETKVNSAWGLTRTTVDDQVKLLSQLVAKTSPLHEEAREYAYGLMSTVNADQEWGVPAAARTGERFTVKNGWLARSADHNLWIINSVGRITGSNTDISIAVLSHNNATMSSGIRLVEKVAKMTRQYLKY